MCVVFIGPVKYLYAASGVNIRNFSLSNMDESHTIDFYSETDADNSVYFRDIC